MSPRSDSTTQEPQTNNQQLLYNHRRHRKTQKLSLDMERPIACERLSNVRFVDKNSHSLLVVSFDLCNPVRQAKPDFSINLKGS